MCFPSYVITIVIQELSTRLAVVSADLHHSWISLCPSLFPWLPHHLLADSWMGDMHCQSWSISRWGGGSFSLQTLVAALLGELFCHVNREAGRCHCGTLTASSLALSFSHFGSMFDVLKLWPLLCQMQIHRQYISLRVWRLKGGYQVYVWNTGSYCSPK